MKHFQVAIIGGGVIGSAISWELSKYKLNIVVFEKGMDICSGTSKANSGVIHSGINSAPNSLKAYFCVKGNKMIQCLSNQLGFKLKFTGKYVIAKNEDEIKVLKKLKKVGYENKVPGLEIHDGQEVARKEPNVSCTAGLWVPTAGIILPYEFTIMLAENAVINGVNFFLRTEVIDLKRIEDGFEIISNKGSFQSDLVINAAGLHCRNIVSMLERPDFEVYPCRGEYLVIDKNYSNLINSMIYPAPPEEFGILGVHITPTIEGNILLGPTAEFIDDPEDKRTTEKMMKILINKAKDIIPKIPDDAIINAFSGIRCKIKNTKEILFSDYRIEESKQNPGFINLIGIESPGLTSAPAIARKVVEMISKSIDMKLKNSHKTINFMKKRFSELSLKEQSDLIKKDERWGRIVCRCEHITEAEIINAISNPLGARTLSSVKFRARAGMGRCQGGFCTQHIIRIMENNFNIDIKDVKLKSYDSNLFIGRTREVKNDKL
jgi:glycerol-3-phosphate dehydrogenase